MTKRVYALWAPVLWVLLLLTPAWPDDGAALHGAMPVPQVQKAPGDTLPITDIHDIRGPAQWGMNPRLVGYGIAGIVLLLAVAALLWRMYLRRRERAGMETLVPEVSPEDAAYNMLEDIAGLMASDARQYYFRLSEILRGYMEKRFHIEALEMTTEELLPELTALHMDSGLKQDIKALIAFADPVKFAKQPVALGQMKNHHELVHRFVQQTTPVLPGFDPDPSDAGAAKPEPEMITGT